MTKRLTIWCNNLFTPLQGEEQKWLRDQVGEHDFHLFEPSENGKDGESARILNEADIAYGSPNPNAVLEAKNLKFIQLNSAGYTAFDTEEIKQGLKSREIILANSSSVYNEPCAQHVLAMMMSLTRKIPQSLDAQRGNKAWKMHELRRQISLLQDETVLIFGFGAIAIRLVELLTPLKMKLIGVRRNVKGNEPIQIITENEVSEYLPQADHIINILPDNAGTQNYFDAEKLSKLKSTAIFYNIGRGTTVDQEVLMRSLEEDKLGFAYLDVTNPEPLPTDHPLWTTKNCFITPHTAGGSANERFRQVGHFVANLNRFLNDEEIIDRII